MTNESVDQFQAHLPDAGRDGLRPLQEHCAFICLFVISAMLTALVLTYTYAERYSAEMTIFFKPSDVTRLSGHSTQALGSPFTTVNLPFKVITQTIAGLVDTDTVLRRIVVDLHLDAEEPKDFSGPWYVRIYKQAKSALSDYAADAWSLLKWGRIIDDDPVSKAIAELRRRIKIRSDDSYLFSVQVKAKTPQMAKAIADHLGEVLVDFVRREDQSYFRKEAEEIAHLRDEKLRQIGTLETSMKDLLVRNAIGSIREEINSTTARASELQKEKSTKQADIRENEGTLATMTDELKHNAPALLARGADSPITVHSGGLIKDGSANNPYSTKLRTEMSNGGLRARLEAIEQSIVTAQNRLQILNQVSATYDQLSVQLRSVERDYAVLSDSLQEVQIQTASAQRELKIQAKAQALPTPVSPIKIYHVLAAGLLAAFVAIGVAYLLDYFGIHMLVLKDPDRTARAKSGAEAINAKTD